MSDISLSKAVRSNLLSLQNTATMMEKTQNRLATGNKVNSALDNPTNFFTASALNARAGDLGALMDSMANGVQTLQAADNGLSAITKTLESMQSVLRQARQDKSFQTQSYELSAGSTGNISFSGGSVGATTREIALQNTALTPAALGMAAAATPTAGTNQVDATSGGATFTLTGTPGNLSVGDTLAMTFQIDGVNQSITITGAEVAAATGGGAAITPAKMREILEDKLTGVTIGGTGNDIVLTSSSTGATSNVNITAATLTDTDASSTVTPTSIGLNAVVAGTPGDPLQPAVTGAATITWGGAPIELNNDAVITFNATVNGTAQTVEISRRDALRVGNGDGTIDNASEFAAILAARIGNVDASAAGNTITVSSRETGAAGNVAIGAATITGTHYDSDEMVRRINSDANLRDRVRASNDDGRLRIENQSTQILNVNGVNSAGTLVGGTTTGATIAGNSVRADLTRQFNELRDQLDKLSDDASFNGVNLLRGDLLTITFNETGTSSIDVQTKDQLALNSAKLEIFDLEPADLDLDSSIDEYLATMKDALATVRTQASNFGQNLSLVENRQNFTKSMINTLETGAANLTLADMNEEAANLLALQTRQQLSSNSLSLASQADQSVLQLLR